MGRRTEAIRTGGEDTEASGCEANCLRPTLVLGTVVDHSFLCVYTFIPVLII